MCVCARAYLYIPSFSAQTALDEGSLPLLFGILLFVWRAGARECVSECVSTRVCQYPSTGRHSLVLTRAAMLSEKSVSVSAGAHDCVGSQSCLRGARGYMRTCPRGLEQAPLLGRRFARPPHIVIPLDVTCATKDVRASMLNEGVHMNAWHGAFLPPPVRSVTAC